MASFVALRRPTFTSILTFELLCIHSNSAPGEVARAIKNILLMKLAENAGLRCLINRLLAGFKLGFSFFFAKLCVFVATDDWDW